MRKWLLGLFVFIAVIFISVGLLLANPHWLSRLIEKQLLKEGISIKIEQMDAQFLGRQYQLISRFSGNSDAYGVRVKGAELAAKIDWLKLIRQEPFIENAVLNNGQLTIDKNRFSQWEKLDVNAGKLSEKTSVSRYLPQRWSVQQLRVGVDEQQLTVNGTGNTDNEIQATISDSDSGNLQLRYDKSKKQIQAQSQQLNLAAITGYPAQLANLSATISTQELSDVHIHSELTYQGISSDIDIKGKDNLINLAATVNGKPLAATVGYDEYGGQLRFNDVELSALKGFRRLLPKAIQPMDISGIASGVIEYDRDKGIRLAAVNVDKAAINQNNFSVSRLSGRFWYQNQQLKYRLNIDDGTLLLPELFNQDENRVTGNIDGVFNAAQQQLTINSLDIASQDFEHLTASGTFDLAANSKLDLNGELINADISKTPRYLPKTMSAKAKKWLSNAFVEGNENNTKFTIKGEAHQLFTANDSVFTIQSQLKNSQLHYLSNNPDVWLNKADLTIDKTSLSVVSQDASIGGLPLTVSADIENLNHTVVKVDAKLQRQSLSKMQAIVAKSIAKKAIARVRKTVKAGGLFDLDLALQLNVSDKNKPDTFDIRLQSDNASINLKQYPNFVLKKAKTNVVIDETGLKEIAAKGKVNNLPMTLTIKKSKKGYDVDALLTADLLKVLPQFKLLTAAQAKVIKHYQLLSGQSRYRVNVDLNNKGELKEVGVVSSLMGTAINLFDVVKKGAKQKNSMIFTYEADNDYLQLQIDKLLVAKAGLGKDGQLSGLVIDNVAKKTRYKSDLTQVKLASQRLNTTALKAFYDAFSKTKNKTKSRKTKYQIDIDVKKATFANGATYPVKIKGDSANIYLKSPIISGNIQFSLRRMNAQLQRIEADTLFNLFKQKSINPGGREVANLNLAKSLPQMDVTVDKVIFKGKNLGNLHLETSFRNGLYSIDQGLLTGAYYFIELAGREVKEPQGITTNIQLDFKGEKILNVMRNFSFNEMIDAKHLDISANLSWPGEAHTLNLQRSYGKAKINGQNVELLTVNSGVGGVVGLMDIAGILKRISLDFENLSSSKISFDTLQGKWNIGGGRGVTRNFYADGSVVALKINGAFDLYRRTFDNVKLNVIPRASNVLPVVGAVAGGVVGVAAGLLIKQVVGDNLDEIVGIPYVLSGTWDKPKLTHVDDIKAKKTQ